MQNLNETVHGKQHFLFQAWARMGVGSILEQKTGTEPVLASVQAGGTQQCFDAKGHKP
jgi:hypothetical protein